MDYCCSCFVTLLSPLPRRQGEDVDCLPCYSIRLACSQSSVYQAPVLTSECYVYEIWDCVLRNLISRTSLEINLLHFITPKRDRKAVADNLVYIWSVFLYRYKKTIGQKENYWYKRKRDQNRLSWLGAPKGWNFHFLASPKSSFWTGFIRFSTWRDAMCVLSINLMLFWSF